MCVYSKLLPTRRRVKQFTATATATVVSNRIPTPAHSCQPNCSMVKVQLQSPTLDPASKSLNSCKQTGRGRGMFQFLGAILFHFGGAQINGYNKLNLFSRYCYLCTSAELGAVVVIHIRIHIYTCTKV